MERNRQKISFILKERPFHRMCRDFLIIIIIVSWITYVAYAKDVPANATLFICDYNTEVQQVDLYGCKNVYSLGNNKENNITVPVVYWKGSGGVGRLNGIKCIEYNLCTRQDNPPYSSKPDPVYTRTIQKVTTSCPSVWQFSESTYPSPQTCWSPFSTCSKTVCHKGGSTTSVLGDQALTTAIFSGNVFPLNDKVGYSGNFRYEWTPKTTDQTIIEEDCLLLFDHITCPKSKLSFSLVKIIPRTINGREWNYMTKTGDFVYTQYKFSGVTDQEVNMMTHWASAKYKMDYERDYKNSVNQILNIFNCLIREQSMSMMLKLPGEREQLAGVRLGNNGLMRYNCKSMSVNKIYHEKDNIYLSDQKKYVINPRSNEIFINNDYNRKNVPSYNHYPLQLTDGSSLMHIKDDEWKIVKQDEILKMYSALFDEEPDYFEKILTIDKQEEEILKKSINGLNVDLSVVTQENTNAITMETKTRKLNEKNNNLIMITLFIVIVVAIMKICI